MQAPFAALSEKSKRKYEIVYGVFMSWQKEKNTNSLTEDVLVSYFHERSLKYKSSSLWAHYSMLRCMLKVNHDVNIEKYGRLRTLLRKTAVGYQAKKSKSLTPAEVKRFLKEAPDETYLATKVALVLGVMGPCKSSELHAMRVQDITDLGRAILVTVPNRKVRKTRRFSITGPFYDMWKKYAVLRPPIVPTDNFFVNYHEGKCTPQNTGINKFGSMGKRIARFLNLPNPERYTGHCFRKSHSIMIDVDEDHLQKKEDDNFVDCYADIETDEFAGAFIKEEANSDSSFNGDVEDFPAENPEEKNLTLSKNESCRQKFSLLADEELKLYNLQMEALTKEITRKEEMHEIQKRLLFQEHEEKMNLIREQHRLKMDVFNKLVLDVP